jgi:hypothetical protein
MTPLTPLRKALGDPQLLGGALPGLSWRAWRILLIAAMGERLTVPERERFEQLTGRKREPGKPVEEFVAVIGRRGGKSKALATLAAYIAGLCEHQLVRGETGVVLCIAPDQRQASIVLDFAAAAFEQSPILRQLIVNRTSDALELSNNVSIEVRAASFRRLRGPTYCAVICDESAFWMSDEWSSNPDVEIINAVKPGLATTGGPLVIASSPYARRGLLWERFRRHFGAKGDKQILVAKGASRVLNPSLPASVVTRAYARDAASAAAEYGASFRTDIEAFVALEVVEACVGDHIELPPSGALKYHAGTDPSGGSGDSMTCCIAHAEGQRIVIDAIREVRPPFSPEAVVDEFCALLKTYRVRSVTGDRYGGEFCRQPFRLRGIEYRLADKAKSDLYRDLLPVLNSGGVLLPKSDKLVAQLVGLERRTARGGRDSIDHAPNSHDDLANAVALACSVVANARQIVPPHMASWSDPFAGFRRMREQEVAAAEAERNCAGWTHPLSGRTIPGSQPCQVNFREVEERRLKNHVEGATVRRGVVYSMGKGR